MTGAERALLAKAKRDALAPLLDLYRAASAKDARTIAGRDVHGLRAAIRALGMDPDLIDDGSVTDLSGYGTEYVGSVSSELDTVHVLVGNEIVEDGEVDEAPVRLVVEDGGDATVAGAFLCLDQSLGLVELIRKAEADAREFRRRYAAEREGAGE